MNVHLTVTGLAKTPQVFKKQAHTHTRLVTVSTDPEKGFDIRLQERGGGGGGERADLHRQSDRQRGCVG